MNYLVTGGAGFIGSALVRRLVGEGHRVCVLDNTARGRAARLEDVRDKIDWVEASVTDADAVADACQGMERVIHLAYINGTELFYRVPELVLEVGVKGIVNTLEGCIRHGVKEFFLASSSEVYQTAEKVPTDETAPLSIPDVLNPRYSYGGGKIISELMVINYGRKYFTRSVIFRPHNVYGPDMGYEHVIPQFILRMNEVKGGRDKETAFPIQGTGEETRAFVYIDDFVDGLMRVMDKGEHLGIYHIGTMDEIRSADLARKIAEIIGRKIRIAPGERRKGGTFRRCPDISRIRALGYCPKILLEEGLKHAVQWYTAHPVGPRLQLEKGMERL